MHTPGPWQVMPSDKAQSPWIVGDAEGGSVADCEPPGPWMSASEADANVRLVAAAPDLLTELKAMLELVDHANEGAFKNGVTDSTNSIDEGEVIASNYCERARAAVAKAELKE